MKKHIHANRKVGTPHHADAALFGRRSGPRGFREPSGCADHHRHANRGQPLDVPDDRRRRREFHGHIDAAKAFGRDAGALGVVFDIEPQRNCKAELGRQMLDEAAHFPVSDNRKVHLGRHVHEFGRCARVLFGGGQSLGGSQKLAHHPLVEPYGFGKVALGYALLAGVRDVNVPRPDQ